MHDIQETINTFFKQFPTVTYPRNQVLITAGESPTHFYYIESGAVKMSTVSKDGKNLVLHTFFPGSYFSLLTLINQSNQYDFVTQTSTTVRKIPKADLLVFLETHSDVLMQLNLRLLQGLAGMLKRIEQATFTSASQQIASLLLYFASHFAESPSASKHSERLSLKITHQEIADWLGLSRENVSLNMKVLSDEGLIKVSNHLIEIPDVPRMRKWSEA